MMQCKSCQIEIDTMRRTGLCDACEERRYTPILEMRGDKWSPLTLGVVSLFCDPMLIPTVLAVVRGVGELRMVARREREGYWNAEHPIVRTGALWGMLLATSRLGIIAVAFASMVLSPMVLPDHPAPHRPAEVDELGEILLDLRRPEHRERGLAQLPQITLDDGDTVRLIDAINRGFGQPPAVEHEIVSRALEVVAQHAPPGDEALYELYPRGDARARGAILERFAASDDRTARTWIGVRYAQERAPDLPELPIELLRGHADEAVTFLPPMLSAPDEQARRHTYELAAAMCLDTRSDLIAGYRTEARGSILVDFIQALARVDALPEPSSLGDRFTPERREAIAHAVAMVNAIACVMDESDAFLEQALAHDDPEISGAAVPWLLLHQRRVPRARVERAIADPLARGALARGLDQHALGALRPEHRRVEAVAQSDVLFRRGTPGFSRIELLWADRGVFVYQLDRNDAEPEHVAIGVYSELYDDFDELPENPRVEVWDAAQPWRNESAGVLVQRVWGYR